MTKYRKAVLRGEVRKERRALVRRLSLDEEVEILKGHVSKDHVHLSVSMPPQLTVGRVTQRVKEEFI